MKFALNERLWSLKMKWKCTAWTGVVAFIISEELEGSLNKKFVWDLMSISAWSLSEPVSEIASNEGENPLDGYRVEL